MPSTLSRLRDILRQTPVRIETPPAIRSRPSKACTDPENAEICALFDAEWYLEMNGDVAAAGVDPLSHFLAFGESEGRNPNSWFSFNVYREAYMGLEPETVSPLRHYLEIGRSLGYDSNPLDVLQYRRLTDLQDQSFGLELPEIRRHIAIMGLHPLIVVYLPSQDPLQIARVQAMLDRQVYDQWMLCTNPARVRDATATLPTEDWGLVWVEDGVQLHPGALYSYASRLNEQPSASVIYADDDQIDGHGSRSRPFIKPDWSPDYLESFNYIGSGAYIAGAAASALEDVNGAYDLVLRATEGDARVEHLRHVLVHRARGLDAAPGTEDVARDTAALEGRLARTGRVGEVSQVRPEAACYDARIQTGTQPLISIVIPTAGKIVTMDGRKIDLITNCIERLTALSTYRHTETIVIHNGNLGNDRLRVLESKGVILIAYNGDFNVARKLNIGAAEARGEFLILLNDDVEPLTPDWIERMVEQCEKPDVGVVGAKLLFPNMTIQHAGVVMVRGKPDHLRFKFPRDDLGYFCSTCAVRNFSAVTGAVMMTRTSLYRRLGGFTESLPVNFNDVDYCLKAAGAGYRTVYTPRAELIHYESMSRAREVKAFEVDFIEREWWRFVTDPYYNDAMLSNINPDYTLSGGRDPLG